MSFFRIGCCIPGGSFMPQGNGSTEAPFTMLKKGYDCAKGCGYDYVEATTGLLMQLSEEELARALSEGIAIEVCNSFIPPHLPIMTAHPGLRAYVSEAMRRMQLIGCDTVILGSAKARSIPEGMSREEALEAFHRFLALCDEIAPAYGMTVLLEPLNATECNFLNRVKEGYDILKSASYSHIHLLADAFHMGMEEEPFSVLADTLSELRHVHVAEDRVRTYPGKETGSDFLPRFSEALKASGYRARVTVECGFDDFEGEAPLAAEFMRRVF